jgi:hypothetical protein
MDNRKRSEPSRSDDLKPVTWPPPPGRPGPATPIGEPEQKKRFIPADAHPLEGMTKSELQAALKLPGQSLKELKDIAKRLERFPPISRESEIDDRIEMLDIKMKKYGDVQIFSCYRCDHTKISNMKAKWKGEYVICGACFDHLTRCIIPYRQLPEHQRPKCIHKVPKQYLKEYR